MDTGNVEHLSYAGLGTLMIHERVLEEDEDREVVKEPIGFVHFVGSDGDAEKKEPILWLP